MYRSQTVQLGTKKYVTAQDLYSMPASDETVNLGARLYDAMQKQYVRCYQHDLV